MSRFILVLVLVGSVLFLAGCSASQQVTVKLSPSESKKFPIQAEISFGG